MGLLRARCCHLHLNRSVEARDRRCAAGAIDSILRQSGAKEGSVLWLAQARCSFSVCTHRTSKMAEEVTIDPVVFWERMAKLYKSWAVRALAARS